MCPFRGLAPTFLWCGLLLVGCDEGGLTARPTLAVEPPSIDFGKVPTGKSRTVELRLTNGSLGAPLTLESVALMDGSAPVFEVEEAPAQIEPGGEATVRVVYTPDDPEPDAGHVEIRSDAFGATRVLVPLTSARTDPGIGVRPQTLDLGSLLSGGRSSGSIRIESRGDATLEVGRISLRTLGFQGEACAGDGDCREGRCTRSRTGLICALPCDGGGCPAGYTCTTGADGYRGCREADGTEPLRAVRGFSFDAPGPLSLLPEETHTFEVTYAPEADDRGGATLIIESNDRERPALAVPLLGLALNLPPVADAAFDGMLPVPLRPGDRVPITGRASEDPEGEPLTFRWRFVVRPEGSRAAFEDATAESTAFVVDRPGRYVVSLEVRDPSGLGSTNDARVGTTAGAGEPVRLELEWDRPGTDLDLHLVSPGAPVGSAGDCYYDNPSPDWAPAGPTGDPTFAAEPVKETITVSDHADGVYTILVAVVAASPQGPTGATVRLFMNDVEVAVFSATIPTSAEAWDVATLSWPTGRIVPLETVR